MQHRPRLAGSPAQVDNAVLSRSALLYCYDCLNPLNWSTDTDCCLRTIHLDVVELLCCVAGLTSLRELTWMWCKSNTSARDS